MTKLLNIEILNSSEHIKVNKNNVEQATTSVSKVIESASYSSGMSKITVQLDSAYKDYSIIGCSLINTSPSNHIAQYTVSASKALNDVNCYVFVYNYYSSSLKTALHISFELKEL